MAAGLLHFYLNTFIPLCEQSDERDIDISALIDASKNCSPILVDYADKNKAVELLPAAIILNFSKTFSEKKSYPKKGIICMTRIIEKSTDIDATAQQTLLVHISKVKIDVNASSMLLNQISKMKVHVATSNNEEKWKELANKVMQHEQINDIVNESMKDFGLLSQSSVSDSVDEERTEITMVEHITTMLRGFCGFNEIFINADHFLQKIDSFKGDVDLLQLITKMDIISVTLHEYAHLKIRKHTGNFNMNSPILAEMIQLPLNQREFGVYNEYRVFNKQVDWFRSAEGNDLDINCIEQFIAAIENGTRLPAGFISGAIPRVSVEGTGVDLYFPFYIC